MRTTRSPHLRDPTVVGVQGWLNLGTVCVLSDQGECLHCWPIASQLSMSVYSMHPLLKIPFCAGRVFRHSTPRSCKFRKAEAQRQKSVQKLKQKKLQSRCQARRRQRCWAAAPVARSSCLHVPSLTNLRLYLLVVGPWEDTLSGRSVLAVQGLYFTTYLQEGAGMKTEENGRKCH